MAQEQRLVGFVKGLAQRLTTISDSSVQISVARLKPRIASAPSLQDISKSVVESLAEASAKSKKLTNQFVAGASKQLTAFSPSSVMVQRPLTSGAILSKIDRFDAVTLGSNGKRGDDEMPFEETMRAAYMSQYDIVRASETDDGELLPIRQQEDKIEKHVESKTEKLKKVFLKDIIPTTKIIPAKVAPIRPTLSQASVDARTRALVMAVRTARSNYSKLSRMEDLTSHLLHFPDARIEATKRGAIAVLLSHTLHGDSATKSQAMLTLGLLGYSQPPNAPGLRILSIDGGGARGLVALEVLRELESMTGKAPCDLFDYFIGVSTGAVVASMLAAFKLSAEESLEFYKRTCISLFARDALKGARRLILSHGYYDTAAWENVLRKNMGEKMMVDLSRDPRGLRLAAVSTKIDEPDCSAFVFRSYGLPSGAVSHYEGTNKHKIWEALRASSAAPGFFQEYRLDHALHQDGGILNNNPTAIGIHESRLLWPKEKLHCIVSMGTGRFKRSQDLEKQQVAKAIGLTSWRSKLTSIIHSATDTEGIHTTLQDLLPPSTYFRVNPFLSEDFGMDISDVKKMEIMIKDSRKYVKENPVLIRQIAEKLTAPRSSIKKANDWMKLQNDCMEFSKQKS